MFQEMIPPGLVILNNSVNALGDIKPLKIVQFLKALAFKALSLCRSRRIEVGIKQIDVKKKVLKSIIK